MVGMIKYQNSCKRVGLAINILFSQYTIIGKMLKIVSKSPLVHPM